MAKTNIKKSCNLLTNSSTELVKWPVQNVLAFQTTCHHPDEKKSSLSNVNTELKNNLPYKGFNLGTHVYDDPLMVKSNRDYIENKMLDGKSIQWLHQVHGSDIAFVNKVSSLPLEADACITENKDVALAIMTADCLPILLSNKEGTKVAAIHGGWRPLAKSVIAKTIKKMDVDVNALVTWLGPCIGQSAFEVGEDVYNIFTEQGSIFTTAFQKKSKGKYLANLHVIARIQLEQLGVTSIHILEECTYSLEHKYYSYRRNSITGRMATIICRI